MNQEYVLWGVAGLSIVYTAAVILAPSIRVYTHRKEHRELRAKVTALGDEIKVAKNHLERAVENFGN